MNRFLAIKAAVAGFCLGIAGMLLVGAASPQSRNTPQTERPPTAIGPQTGRFQVASSAAMFVILDTATGQAWMGDLHSTLTPGNPAFFDPKLTVRPESRVWE